MDNNEIIVNSMVVVDTLIEKIKYFRKLIAGNIYMEPEETYKSLGEDAAVFKFIIDEVYKKIDADILKRMYKDLYLPLLPYFKDEIQIENIQFEFSDELEDDHTLSLYIYIEEELYGIFNPINRTYKLPNINRMKEIENEVLELSEKYDKHTEKMEELADKIKHPRKRMKEDPSYILKRFVNKQTADNDIQAEFRVEHDNQIAIEQRLKELEDEYLEYDRILAGSKLHKEKLELRLLERLKVTIEDELQFSSLENDEEMDEEQLEEE